MPAGLTTPRPTGTPRSDNEAKYRSRNPLVRRLVHRFLARVGGLVEAHQPRRVLEIGCGEGIVIEYLSARLPTARFAGVEPDRRALDRARARCPRASFIQADAYQLPFRSRCYDLVLCLEVLEHLADPDRALLEIRRVSGRGCLLSVPHEPFFRLGNLARGKNVGRLGDPSDHVQHWRSADFTAFCARQLSVRITTGSFPWLLVYATV